MSAETASLYQGRIARWGAWASRVSLSRNLVFVIAIAALGAAVATYWAMTGRLSFGSATRTVLILLLVDLVLALLLCAFVAVRLVHVWMQRRRGSAGARLHTRLVVWFSLIAVAPAIIVAVFSAIFFNFGIQAWFSSRVSTALKESLAVAEAYQEEHLQAIRGDILAMAKDLNADAMTLSFDSRRMAQALTAQGMLRDLTEAVVYDSAGRTIARWSLSYVLTQDPIPPLVLRRANDGDLIFLSRPSDDRIRALVRLDNFSDGYLYVARYVEQKVIDHIERTRQAVAQYENLEGQRSGFQITFAMMFVIVALMLLMAAIWLGLNFATGLVRPISALVAAAERVRAGDLSARVPEGPDNDELAAFSRAFNRMTEQLEAQRRELVSANVQHDARRQFIETVLTGVSAGVIGLDADGRINLSNKSASQLVSEDLARHLGEPLGEVVPEMAMLVDRAMARPDRMVEAQITLQRDKRNRTLHGRVVCERDGKGNIGGLVVTFDDVSDLLAAQRKAAWADVARRIAHEIKNPLTPIQLSAERLRRKYLKQIQIDPETFSACTDTIIRQVGDIGRMVDEFSSFARMPAPVMRSEDVRELVRRALILPRNANPAIAFHAALGDDPVVVLCDSRQIGQALTNLLQNAVHAINEREEKTGESLPPGEIAIAIGRDDLQIYVEVSDNGKGLPPELRDRLTDPYVTTRAKGTGLGLAIVKKIMEDHGGELVLGDRPGGGARLRLVFGPQDPAMVAETGSAPAKVTADGV